MSSTIPPSTASTPTTSTTSTTAAGGTAATSTSTGETAVSPAPPAENPLAQLMAVDEDGLTFANKTAQWIAHERHIESQRPAADRLFYDPLAKHMAGKYGKTLSDLFAGHSVHIFPGLGEQGFLLYHAARTKLISVHIAQWSSTVAPGGPKQVVNLGCGYDTRAYWDQSLAGVDVYMEVDEHQVNGPKETVLQQVQELPAPVCPRRCVSLDFSTQTTKDVSKHGHIATAPTMWILEGLIMYLEEDAVRGLYEDISALSCAGSYAIINVVQNRAEHHRAEYADQILVGKGWTKVSEAVMFGDPDFAFGRYPSEVPVNKNGMGFAFYRRTSI